MNAPAVDRGLDEVLLSLVRNMTVAVSGEKLARDLGVSHSRVVRLVDRLRREGVEILGEPFTGYRLTRLPDILIPELLGDRLHTGSIGRRIHHYYAIDSTNRAALSMLADGDTPHGAVVLAERQTAGRGRLGRDWVSLPGVGLYFSMILRPPISASLAPLLTLGAAVAAHDAIERRTAVEVDIKWPNDLLVSGKKVGGILSEMQAEVDRVRGLVVGLGINVNHTEFPDEIREVAVSLRMAAGKPQSRTEILLDFLGTFERLYERFVERGPKAIIEPWCRSSSFAEGRVLEVDDGVRRIRGTTEGLNPLGALRLRTESGDIEEVYSGDVISWK